MEMVLRNSVIPDASILKNGKKSKKISWSKEIDRYRRCAPKGPPLPPECGHSCSKFECSILDKEEMESFHRRFYYTRDKAIQDAFILRHCQGRSPLRSSSVILKKRRVTASYYIPSKERNIRVCKATFIRILRLKMSRINSVVKSFYNTQDLSRRRKCKRRRNVQNKIKQLPDSSSVKYLTGGDQAKRKSRSEDTSESETFLKSAKSPSIELGTFIGSQPNRKDHSSQRRSVTSRPENDEDRGDAKGSIDRKLAVQKKGNNKEKNNLIIRQPKIARFAKDLDNYLSLLNKRSSVSRNNGPTRLDKDGRIVEAVTCKGNSRSRQRKDDEAENVSPRGARNCINSRHPPQTSNEKKLTVCTPVGQRIWIQRIGSVKDQQYLPVETKEVIAVTDNKVCCQNTSGKELDQDIKSLFPQNYQLTSNYEQSDCEWLNPGTKPRRIFDWSPLKSHKDQDHEVSVLNDKDKIFQPLGHKGSEELSNRTGCSTSIRTQRRRQERKVSVGRSTHQDKQADVEDHCHGLVYESKKRRLRKLQRAAEEKENLSQDMAQEKTNKPVLNQKLKTNLIDKNSLSKIQTANVEHKTRLPLQTIQYFKNQRFIFSKASVR